MAQVTKAKHDEIDRLLDLSSASWEEMPEVAKEAEAWDRESLEAYLAELPLEEDRLARLEAHAEAGLMDEAQLERHRRLLKLAQERRPLLERLRAP